MQFDYLIVGAGLAGAVVARQLTYAGKRCLVVEKNNHVGGACYDEQVEDYYAMFTSGHIFHTSSATIWEYVNRFSEWLPYHHKVMSRVGDRVYSFPINLMTLHQLWGVTTPSEARAAIEERRVAVPDRNANMESWCLSQIGEELYELFIRGYTTKQWKRPPCQLPASIVKRLPMRLTWDDCYFTDTWQAMPTHGYTQLIASMLDGIKVELGIDYLQAKRVFDPMARHVVFTGPIDAYFGHRFGKLDYRTCQFDQVDFQGDFQGAATINYPSSDVAFTRIVEYQHFYSGGAKRSVVMMETPSDEGEPYYPVRDEANTALYERYAAMKHANVTFLGRLGSYLYMDMAPVIGQALKVAKELLS